MKEKYREAFSEVAQIINLMPSNLLSRIPLEFKQIIQEEKSKTYMPNITEPLEQCELKNETIIILALIYRDFLCSQKERINLLARDTHNLVELEKQLRIEISINILKKNIKQSKWLL